MIFLKLGGSLITNKRGVEEPRYDVLYDVAQQIRQALATDPDLKLVLGHGSGSFGHVAGAKHGTRSGVDSAENWRGFTEVARAAAQLNQIVRNHLWSAGLNVISLPPSSSAVCEDGNIISLALDPIEAALSVGLIPLIMGDVAFDCVRGGTIVSTEEVMTYIAQFLRPHWLLLAGETDGVYDHHGRVIPLITRANFAEIRSALGGSDGTDVTGGMLSKVVAMLNLVEAHPTLSIRIFSGLQPDTIKLILSDPQTPFGTVIK